MITGFLSLLMIGLTIVVYILTAKLYQRYPFPLLLPIITSTIILIVLLVVTKTHYETYMVGGKWINQLLGPAVVALAYPLYKSKKTLLEHFYPIVSGVLTGTGLAILSVLILSFSSGMKGKMVLSLLPKSVTTPIALAISNELGGVPSITVTAVMVAGIFGASVGPYILNLFRVKGPLGRGMGLGSASHAIGTSKALEEGHFTGAISSTAMILCGLLTAIILPLIARWLS